MRDPDRIARIMIELGIYWYNHPDLRLGQIMWIMAGGDPHSMEEDVLLDRLLILNGMKDDEIIEAAIASLTEDKG